MNKKISPRKQFSNAVKKNDIATVKQLINERKVKPEAYNNSAITEAARLGYSEIVYFLLQQKNVDQSVYGFYSLNHAIYNEDQKTINILLNDQNTNFSKSYYAGGRVKGIILSEIRDNEDFTWLLKLFMKNHYFRKEIKALYPDRYQKLLKYEVKEKISAF